jgi:hypothetical protein
MKVLAGVVAIVVASGPTSRAVAAEIPLPGIAVVIKCIERPAEPAVAKVTDGNGAFVLRNLARGTYKVEYDRSSFAVAVAKSGDGAKARCSLNVIEESAEPGNHEREQSLDLTCGSAESFIDSAFIARNKGSYRLSLTVER